MLFPLMQMPGRFSAAKAADATVDQVAPAFGACLTAIVGVSWKSLETALLERD